MLGNENLEKKTDYSTVFSCNNQVGGWLRSLSISNFHQLISKNPMASHDDSVAIFLIYFLNGLLIQRGTLHLSLPHSELVQQLFSL